MKQLFIFNFCIAKYELVQQATKQELKIETKSILGNFGNIYNRIA